jgi:trigger factor
MYGEFVFHKAFDIVHCMKTTVTKLDNAQVKIDAVLKAKDLEKYREAVMSSALDNLEVDGFRKGKVPQDIAESKINSMRVLEEMAHQAISEKYIDIIKKHDIKAIGQPQISITKIAEGADLEFSITTAVLPDIKLGDYKKIAKKLNKEEVDTEVSQEELDTAILNLRKMKAQQEMSVKAQEEAKEAEEAAQTPSWSDIDEKDLPELNDEWAKAMGPFENLEDFQNKMKENLKAEKESKNIEKKRISIIDEILENSDIEVPQMMVDYEVDKMMHEFEHNITMTGMKFDEYLSSINKTRDDYKQQWQEQGLKRAKTQLMLNNIAANEKIDPSDEDIEAEVAKIMEQYKDQQGIDENSVRSYVSSVLTHQKVFEYLENLK